MIQGVFHKVKPRMLWAQMSGSFGQGIKRGSYCEQKLRAVEERDYIQYNTETLRCRTSLASEAVAMERGNTELI